MVDMITILYPHSRAIYWFEALDQFDIQKQVRFEDTNMLDFVHRRDISNVIYTRMIICLFYAPRSRPSYCIYFMPGLSEVCAN